MSTSTLPALVRALGYDSAPTFGPLWRDPAYVMNCLCVYLKGEGHAWAFGRTVKTVAETFLSDPYAATGEELGALACLLMLNRGEMLVTVMQDAPSPVR